MSATENANTKYAARQRSIMTAKFFIISLQVDLHLDLDRLGLPR
jgi:hypothetical protein